MCVSFVCVSVLFSACHTNLFSARQRIVIVSFGQHVRVCACGVHCRVTLWKVCVSWDIQCAVFCVRVSHFVLVTVWFVFHRFCGGAFTSASAVTTPYAISVSLSLSLPLWHLSLSLSLSLSL